MEMVKPLKRDETRRVVGKFEGEPTYTCEYKVLVSSMNIVSHLFRLSRNSYTPSVDMNCTIVFNNCCGIAVEWYSILVNKKTISVCMKIFKPSKPEHGTVVRQIKSSYGRSACEHRQCPEERG